MILLTIFQLYYGDYLKKNGGVSKEPEENHWPAASHWQTLLMF